MQISLQSRNLALFRREKHWKRMIHACFAFCRYANWFFRLTSPFAALQSVKSILFYVISTLQTGSSAQGPWRYALNQGHINVVLRRCGVALPFSSYVRLHAASWMSKLIAFRRNKVVPRPVQIKSLGSQSAMSCFNLCRRFVEDQCKGFSFNHKERRDKKIKNSLCPL